VYSESTPVLRNLGDIMQKELPVRKNIRLQGYDYSQNGAYFITICSYCRENLFGEIVVGQGLCSCRLSNVGNIIENEISQLPIRYTNIKIDNYVVMPNHIHLILSIVAERQEQSPCPTIGDIICALKSITTKRANNEDLVSGRKIWQFRFHDHIIRDELEYQKIWQYINENPAKWADDCYYSV